MTKAVATVEQLSDREVNTRFGKKKTYSFKANNEWYSTAFKAPKVSVGDVVSFEFEETKYGKNVDPATIEPSLAPSFSPAPPPVKRDTYQPKGVFPIPALDGQRSIVRQNALTNARETVVALLGTEHKLADADYLAARIIEIARKYEGYTAGDSDLSEVKKEMEASDAKGAA